MMGGGIKCAPDILFRVTKKEAELVKKLPRHKQDEFEDYLKLRYKFNCLCNGMFSDGVNKTESSFDPSSQEYYKIRNSNSFI